MKETWFPSYIDSAVSVHTQSSKASEPWEDNCVLSVLDNLIVDVILLPRITYPILNFVQIYLDEENLAKCLNLM